MTMRPTEMIYLILMLTPVLATVPVEFIISKSEPREETIELPEDLEVDNGLELFIKVDHLTDYDTEGSGIIPEKEGKIKFTAKHPRFQSDKTWEVRVDQYSTTIPESKNLCFLGNETMSRKFTKILAESDMSSETNVKLTLVAGKQKCKESTQFFLPGQVEVNKKVELPKEINVEYGIDLNIKVNNLGKSEMGKISFSVQHTGFIFEDDIKKLNIEVKDNIASSKTVCFNFKKDIFQNKESLDVFAISNMTFEKYITMSSAKRNTTCVDIEDEKRKIAENKRKIRDIILVSVVVAVLAILLISFLVILTVVTKKRLSRLKTYCVDLLNIVEDDATEDKFSEDDRNTITRECTKGLDWLAENSGCCDYFNMTALRALPDMEDKCDPIIKKMYGNAGGDLEIKITPQQRLKKLRAFYGLDLDDDNVLTFEEFSKRNVKL